MILIVAALKAELIPFMELFQTGPKNKINGGSIYPGESVSLLRTGIGQEKARQVLESFFKLYHCDYILNIGFAGAISDTYRKGDIVSVSQVINEESKNLPITIRNIDFISLKSVRLITVNKAVLNSERRSYLQQKYETDIVDMEGYAFAELCRENNTPFSSIKIISDLADKQAVKDFLKNYKMLAGKMIPVVKKTIENLL
jgi:adenosylhomocysteine nucleosidase